MKSKKNEESYYVAFNDNYIKSFQKEVSQCKEVFPSSCSKTIPLVRFDGDFLDFFYDPNMIISAEEKAVDNEGDELMKP